MLRVGQRRPADILPRDHGGGVFTGSVGTKAEGLPGWGGLLRIKPLAVTYSRMQEAHYHRRGCVSLPSSGWDRVVPQRYGRQGRGRSSATAPASKGVNE